MGYVLCVETSEGRRAQADWKFQRTYERSFKVKTDSPLFGPYYAASHPSLPLLRSSYPEDLSALCNSLIPVQDPNDPTLWTITATYIYLTYPGEGIPDPLLRPTEYEIDGVTWPEAIWMDRSGNPIVNSAGDPFLPPLELPRAGATIIVRYNAAAAPDATWFDAQGTLNATTMTIGPYIFTAERVKLEKVKAAIVYETASAFWRWEHTWTYKPMVPGTVRQAHKAVLLDQGRRELISGVRVPIIDPGTGLVADQPLPLNGSGLRLPVGSPAVYAVFDTHGVTVFPSM